MSLFGGISNIGYLWDDAFQLWVGIGGILPDLESLRAEVHIYIVLVFIQTAALLVIHIAKVLLVALKEHFVATHNASILIDTGIQTGTQSDNLFYLVGREERVAIDLL